MGKLPDRISQGNQKMVNMVLTVVFSLLVLEQVGAKQCFDCVAKADQPELSNCGNFDEMTAKCTVEEDGFCYKAAIYRVNGTARGERVNMYFCDGYGDYTEEALCSENGCRDVTLEGVTALVCCCGTDLCNTDESFPNPTTTTASPSNAATGLFCSVLVVLSVLLTLLQ